MYVKLRINRLSAPTSRVGSVSLYEQEPGLLVRFALLDVHKRA